MATSINCYLKMSLTTLPNTSSIAPLNPPKAAQNPWSWQGGCFSRVAVATILISSSLVLFIEEGYDFTENLQVQVEKQGKAMRWSDRRTCPQWRTNALENIVPENLPRRSDARRRSNAMTVRGNIPLAAGLVTGDVNRCFSL